MTQHYNIGKKIEVNPFENVNFIKLAEYSQGKEYLKPFLDKNSIKVTTRKINDEWVILYDIKHLNFTTLLEWKAPYRGKFYMPYQYCHKSIEFNIQDDLMICW